MARRLRLAFMLGLALCVVVAVAGAAAGSNNLLSDGNFEHPTLLGEYDAGSALGPWSVTKGQVELNPSEPGIATAPHGKQLLALTGHSGGGDGEICQAVSGLTPGAGYSVRVLAAAYAHTPRSAKAAFDVTVAGVRVGQVRLPTTSPAVFERYNFTVNATAASEWFCVRGRATPFAYPLVDSIALSPASN